MTQIEKTNSWLRTPLVQLLTDGKSFDNKSIGVAGYLSTDFEDSRLYLTKDFGDLKVHENGIAVEFAKVGLIMRLPAKERRLDSFHHQFVVLCGTFHAKDKKLSDVSVITPLWRVPTQN